MEIEYSLYFHIPFCTHRCAYCDFNTYAGQETLISAYVEAMCREIRIVASFAAEKLKAHTLFFGGGTPSLLSTAQLESILKAVKDSFTISPGAEISIEANPGTVTLQSLWNMRGLGFNRLSLGVQSAQPNELHQLERIHDYFDVIDAIDYARHAGFENLNLDLIFGLPDQVLEHWQSTVRLILNLRPEHLSLYALTVEPGTPFGRWARRGLISMPDPDLAADMYEWAGEALELAGFEQYEISNWAKPGFECQHNIQIWRTLPYLGFGAGAHGYANNMRISNVVRIRTYIERLSSDFGYLDPPVPVSCFPLSPVTVHQTRVSMRVEMQETMMTGLRLTRDGVSEKEFSLRFGSSIRDNFGNEISELSSLGLLEQSGDIVRLTKRGRLLGNQVFIRFVD